MKKSKAKYLTLAGLALSAGLLLAACSNSLVQQRHTIMYTVMTPQVLTIS